MGQNDNPNEGPTDATSLSLLDRVRVRDTIAWERLVQLYEPLVACWCRRCGLTVDDANDVSQEVFSSVVRNIGSFRRDRPGDTFRGWLRIIARNEIRRHYRRKERSPEAIGGSTAHIRLQQMADQRYGDEELAEDEPSELRDLFHRGLDLIRTEFENHTWQAFSAVVLEQRSTADVADDLGMSAAAVRQARYRVLRRLCAELGELLS